MHERRFPFEKVARLDSAERRERQPPEPLVELLSEGAPRRILDIGVGTGYFALPLAERLPEAVVVGSDVEPRMLEIFRERAEARGLLDRTERLRVPERRANEVPGADGAFDLAFMVNLYHELDDRPAYLREVRRVLGAGGRLVVCDWDPEGTGEAGPPRDHRVALDTCRRELGDAGFQGLEVRRLYADHYTLVGRAP